MTQKQIDFSEYKPIGEPSKEVKRDNWDIAIGLQAVDGLTPSKYLRDIAKEHTEGKITIGDVHKCLDAYYKSPEGKAQGTAKEEADKVSARITEILNDPSFTFSPIMYISVHKFLFLYESPEIAGQVRRAGFLPQYPDGNIIKNESVLGWDTVRYGEASVIKESLADRFSEEKKDNYFGLDARAQMERMAKFISDIWQIHPFYEGNTRTSAVFAIKYLHTLGFNTNNDLFKNMPSILEMR